MSSHTPGYPYLYNSRHAVDGGRGIDSCFFTDKEQSPWWQVDLRYLAQVGKVVMYTGFSGNQYNNAPLTVSVSSDGRQWRTARINDRGTDSRRELVFDPPEPLRFLHIKAPGECVLSFNEIEIYPPDAK